MPCKICKEWEKEATRHRETCRELSIKLANLQEEYAIAIHDFTFSKEAQHDNKN